ncbi:MAG: type I-E CRISPR-associated protein Cse1/CasA [Clostridia bacterium]|nr:type I-E CRISPR-associated protein Cse1/CasA [Clostridia bacterium]
MKERKFNLLDEPWIRVLRPDGGVDKTSIIGVFSRAPTVVRLSGELPTQDVAILRLLEAILHSVFSRYSLTDGTAAPLESADEALDRWQEVWERGCFPVETIERYLRRYYDRFWFVDPEYPFMQVSGLDAGTEYGAAKLNGELAESGNKIRLFPQRAGKAKQALEYDEAARWLFYLNGFDDTSSKATVRKANMPSPGAGWLGKLGVVIAEGNNLFETLMLNLILVKSDGEELWGEERPIWEREKVSKKERVLIAMPDNLSELYTMASRRIALKHENDRVVGYRLIGGDFFEKENALAEQMTRWNNAAKRPNDPPQYLPRRHDPSRQMWRDFSSLIAQKEGGKRPGVVDWLARLFSENVISRSSVRLRTITAKYADKDFFIDDVAYDSLTLSTALFTEEGESWISMVLDVLEDTELLVNQLAYLAQCVAKAAGDDSGRADYNSARNDAYFNLDLPFRAWLEQLNISSGSQNEAAKEWWDRAKSIVRAMGRELFANAGTPALIGKTLIENKKQVRYCAPEAYNRFLYRTATRDTLKQGGKKNGG